MTPHDHHPSLSATRDRYLRLLRKALVNELYIELEAQLVYAVLCASHHETPELNQLTAARGNRELIEHLRELKHDGDTLVLKGIDGHGRSVPDASLRNHAEFAHTMIGCQRLDKLRDCIETILEEDIPGDLLQAGCWRGGSAVFMRGVLAASGCSGRKLWVADSFQGLPESAESPDSGYEMDKSVLPVLSVSLEEVRELFRRYELLDDQVRFIEGWFGESLAKQPPAPLALLHIDADLYLSTRDVLENCHDRVSSGGFVIVDDYGILPPCREAVDEFLAQAGLGVQLQTVGKHAVCWRMP